MARKPAITDSAVTNIKVLDGVYPPLLYEAGFDPARPIAEAVLLQPATVAAAHARFVRAGAHVITTLTGAANPLFLSQYSLADRAEQINREAAALARRAVGPKTMVFGAIGPSHLFLETDEVSLDDLRDAFRRQAAWLIEAGVDGIVLEGMSDLAEALTALEAVRSIRALPLAACMTFQTRGESFATSCDITPEQASLALEQGGADWIGCHGGLALTESPPLVKLLAASTSKPLWLRLDVAQPEYEDRKLVYRQTPAEFAGILRQLAGLRVRVVGGGQGATPEHVAALRAVVDGAQRP